MLQAAVGPVRTAATQQFVWLLAQNETFHWIHARIPVVSRMPGAFTGFRV
ncbi:MAG: hypothetical protein JWR10_3111 [Rubritepida sp.]|nr:hypothetical protein [Rubritepida sp.]